MFIGVMGVVNLVMSAVNVYLASGNANYGAAVLAFGVFLIAMYVGNDN